LRRGRRIDRRCANGFRTRNPIRGTDSGCVAFNFTGPFADAGPFSCTLSCTLAGTRTAACSVALTVAITGSVFSIHAGVRG